jgi:hypothetical protein
MTIDGNTALPAFTRVKLVDPIEWPLWRAAQVERPQSRKFERRLMADNTYC